MRSILFFDGNGLGRWLSQLVIWTGSSLLVLALAARAKTRRSATANQGQIPEENPSSDPEEEQQKIRTAGTPAVAGSVQASHRRPCRREIQDATACRRRFRARFTSATMHAESPERGKNSSKDAMRESGVRHEEYTKDATRG